MLDCNVERVPVGEPWSPMLIWSREKCAVEGRPYEGGAMMRWIVQL